MLTEAVQAGHVSIGCIRHRRSSSAPPTPQAIQQHITTQERGQSSPPLGPAILSEKMSNHPRILKRTCSSESEAESILSLRQVMKHRKSARRQTFDSDSDSVKSGLSIHNTNSQLSDSSSRKTSLQHSIESDSDSFQDSCLTRNNSGSSKQSDSEADPLASMKFTTFDIEIDYENKEENIPSTLNLFLGEGSDNMQDPSFSTENFQEQKPVRIQMRHAEASSIYCERLEEALSPEPPPRVQKAKHKFYRNRPLTPPGWQIEESDTNHEKRNTTNLPSGIGRLDTQSSIKDNFEWVKVDDMAVSRVLEFVV